MGCKIVMDSFYHPHRDGQNECTIQMLEDMMYAYNTEYNNNIHIAPYKALYRALCRSPVGPMLEKKAF